MPIIPLPNKITWETIDENTAKFVVEPCWAGYGTTLGNALRRVMLSSLEGAAVTKVKIKNVDHEFSTLPGIKEDIVHLLMRIKKLRFQMHVDEPVILHLKIKGKVGDIKASDIEKNADIEPINKDFVITSMSDKNAEFNMEMTVEKGLGYVPVEARKTEEKEVGVLSVDSFFSPVTKVGFEVEPARVGQDINYDRLILTVYTDGTMTPKAAMNKSLDILLEHFNLLQEHTDVDEPKPVAKKTTKKKKSEDDEEDKESKK